MNYRFGQFRKEQFTKDFVQELNINSYELAYQESEDLSSRGSRFRDIIIRKSFSPEDGSLLVRFAATRFDRETRVTIKLAKEQQSAFVTDNTQVISQIILPAAVYPEQMTQPMVFDIIVTPNDNYGQLMFVIDRDSMDYMQTPRTWTKNSTFVLSSFGKITNIISSGALDLDGETVLKQIGVQSRPGLEMCINGAMIRVGRSGMYELNHGMDINFIGFIPNPTDHFIMDYQY